MRKVESVVGPLRRKAPPTIAIHHPRTIDEDVDPAKLFNSLLDSIVDRVFRRDIAFDIQATGKASAVWSIRYVERGYFGSCCKEVCHSSETNTRIASCDNDNLMGVSIVLERESGLRIGPYPGTELP
jgi:hypothetical protein